MAENVSMDSYYGQIDSSFYAGPKGTDFHIRKVYGNLREMLEDTINDSTVLIGDYFLVNYGNQNTPDDGTGNPNGKSYNRNKAIDNYDGDGPDPGIAISDILAVPGYYNATLWCRKETEITQSAEGVINPFDYYELMFQSVAAMPEINVTTHTINAGSVPTASITGTVESRTIDFGLPTPWGFTATVTAASPSVTPTAALEDISGNTTTKRVHFTIPKAWGMTIGTVTTGNPGTTPTASMGTSGDNKQLNLTLPKAWDITATVTPTAEAASVSVTQSSTTKTFAFQLPVVDATQVNPNLVYNPWFTVNTRGFEQYRGEYCPAYEYINDNDETITVLRTLDIPGKLHWINATSLVQNFNEADYTFDSWQAIYTAGARDPGHTIVEKNTGDIGIKLTHNNPSSVVADADYSQYNSASIISFLDNPELLIGKTVTLSVDYEKLDENGQSTGVIKGRQTGIVAAPLDSSSQLAASCVIDRFRSNDGAITATAKIITTYQGFVGILLQARKNSTTIFRKVKVEIGGYSTLDYDTEPNYYEEYNKCIHRYNTSPSNQYDDYARTPVDNSALSAFTLTSDKVSSLYEIGMTYFDHADEVVYSGQIGSTGSILNQENEDINLIDGKVPMVCASFAQLMLAGIPYERSRMKTYTEKGNNLLIGGTNAPQIGKSCFDMYSPVIKNYFARYPTTKQLYSSSFAKLLYDAGLLHEIRTGDEIRPGDLIFFDAPRQYSLSEYNNDWDSTVTYAKDAKVKYTLNNSGQDGSTRYYKSLKNNNINYVPYGNPSWWEEVHITTYRRWGSMQHVELFLGWSVNAQTASPIKGQALCVSAQISPYLGYRTFLYPSCLTSESSRLKWYARLSAGSGVVPINLFEQQSISNTNLPYTWERVSNRVEDDDKNWEILYPDEGKFLEPGRAYNIIIKVNHEDIGSSYSWHFSLYGLVEINGQKQEQRIADTTYRIYEEQLLFKIGPKLYSCCFIVPSAINRDDIIGIAVAPNSVGAVNQPMTLENIWIYDKIVAP